MDEDASLHVLFQRLSERDRRSHILYIADARIPEVRARRAALVMMSLRASSS